jgi:hypothetical protein
VQIASDSTRVLGGACLFPRAARRHVVAVVLTALVLTIGLMVLSPAYGTTFDEPRRHSNGVDVLEFYTGSLTYDHFKANRSGSHLYGALFDLTAAALDRRLGGDVWMTRHYLAAAFGGLGILATGLLGLRVMGPGGGLLAMALLTLSPRYVGHSMNNPKDLPFAAVGTLALVGFATLRCDPPFLPWSGAVLIGLLLGLPLAVRPGALLYVGYLALLLAALIVYARAWRARELLAILGRATVAVLIMLVVGALFWPWAQLNPLVRPVQAFFEVSKFDWPGQVLFAGAYPSADALPWTYLPGWMLVTIPPVVLAGLAVTPIQAVRCRGIERGWRIALWLVAAIPIIGAVVRGSTLYDGWRHMLFVYPPLVVLAASGWRDLLAAASRWPIALTVTLVALGVGLLEPFGFMLRNHPNEVVYFNGLVGGPRGAFGRYEMDYWGNSLLQATEWSAGIADAAGAPVSISGWPYSLVEIDARRFRSLVAYAPERGQHHLFVQLLRGSPQALKDMMSRGDAVHVVRTADGAPLALVRRGPRFGEVAAAVSRHLHRGER